MKALLLLAFILVIHYEGRSRQASRHVRALLDRVGA